MIIVDCKERQSGCLSGCLSVCDNKLVALDCCRLVVVHPAVKWCEWCVESKQLKTSNR